MSSEASVQPWYKQFWPWFIFALPATVVVACIVTVAIAYRYADTLVQDDYYKEGLAINERLHMERVARAQRLSAELMLDLLVGELRLRLSGDLHQWPENIQLHLEHPTDRYQDLDIPLQRNLSGDYFADLPQSISGRWYLRLRSYDGEPWQLKSEVIVEDGATAQHFSFAAEPGDASGG